MDPLQEAADAAHDSRNPNPPTMTNLLFYICPRCGVREEHAAPKRCDCGTMMEAAPIFPDDPQAARLVTVTGWVSRHGRFYGDDERLARYDGSTHSRCSCGGTMDKHWLLCDNCRAKAADQRFNAMPEADWDGKAMLYSERDDRYYSSPEDVPLAEGETLADYKLVICEPSHASMDSSFFDGILPEEGCDELEAAIEAFNKAVENVVVSWGPGKTRLRIGESK